MNNSTPKALKGLIISSVRRDRWGSASIIGLIVIGLLFSVFGALEPIVLEILNPKTFDVPKATIVGGGVVLAFLMMVFGILELVKRRQCKRLGVVPADCLDETGSAFWPVPGVRRLSSAPGIFLNAYWGKL